MATSQPSLSGDAEIDAISVVYQSVKTLDASAQLRVLRYVAGKLGLAPIAETHIEHDFSGKPDRTTELNVQTAIGHEQGEVDGISPIALKWMSRNSLTIDSLSPLFSLGVDEIDLVAKSIPGKAKKERTYNVALLKGIAAYLASGAARVTQEQIKEACLHYDAFDSPNFATYLRSFASDLSGSKSSGFTLTARGLTNATALIKEITQVSSK